MSEMSKTRTISPLSQSFGPETFKGIQTAGYEPWLYGIWHLIWSLTIGFLSGIIYSPLVTYLFPLTYSYTTGQMVLPLAGELALTALQIMTGTIYGIGKTIGLIRVTMDAHSQYHLPVTLRFGNGKRAFIPFIVDENNIREIPNLVPGWHAFLIPVSIPQKPIGPLQKIAMALHLGYWSNVQPIDYCIGLSQGSKSETLADARGLGLYKGVLTNCPKTCPIDVSVYYGKKYEKDGKVVPVFNITGSDFAPDQTQRLAALAGLKFEELKSLDEALDHHYALEKDETIDRLEKEILFLRASKRSDAARVDEEITDDERWKKDALDDEPIDAAKNKLASKWGVLGVIIVIAGTILIYELVQYHVLR